MASASRHPWFVQRLMRVFEDFVYGFDSGVDVPMEAAHALVRGFDSPGLRDLAGLDRERDIAQRREVPVGRRMLLLS